MLKRDNGPYWFHVTTSNAFAKHVVKRVLRDITASQAKECVARSAGFEGMADALERPRKIDMSFDEWVSRLEETLAIGADELLSREELRQWYLRLFVTHSPMCLGPGPHGGIQSRVTDRATETDEDPHYIPTSVSHEQTVVDRIASSGERMARPPDRRRR